MKTSTNENVRSPALARRLVRALGPVLREGVLVLALAYGTGEAAKNGNLLGVVGLAAATFWQTFRLLRTEPDLAKEIEETNAKIDAIRREEELERLGGPNNFDEPIPATKKPTKAD